MKNTKMNLCNTCEENIPECKSSHKDVKYGNGKGDDNIIECKYYNLKSNLNKGCCPNCGCDVLTEHGLGKYICCKCFEVY